MKKYKYLLLSLLISLLIPSTIYAECTEEDLQDFKEKEKEFTIKYEFDKESKLYSITFNNPNPEEYEYTIKTNIEAFKDCSGTDDKIIKCKNIESGKYDIEINGNKENCKETLKKIELVLPQFNKYSEDPLCSGIEEFVLCQPTYDKSIDYETFVSRVNTYKKNHEEKKEIIQESQKNKNESKILKYVKDNIVQIIVIAVFIIMILITIILTIKSAKQSRRLE